MNYKKKIVIISIIVGIIVIGLSIFFIVRLVEKNNAEKELAEKNAANMPYSTSKYIVLEYDYNPKNETEHNKMKKISIDRRNDIARLSYAYQNIDPNDESTYGNSESYYADFTTEKYDELLQLVLKDKLIPYTAPSDENGKITDKTEPYVILLINSTSGKRDAFIPSNIEEIRKVMEDMAASAKDEDNKRKEARKQQEDIARSKQNNNDGAGLIHLPDEKTGVGGIPGTDDNSSDTTYIIDNSLK